MMDQSISLSLPRTHWIILLGLLLLAPFMALAFVPAYQLIGLGACLLAVLTLPLLGQRRIDWFSPWNWLIYSAFVGVFLRAIYITFDIPDRARIQEVFLLDQSRGFLLGPALVVLAGMLLLTLGYLAGPRSSSPLPFRVFRSDRWSERRFWWVVLGMLLLSWVGLALFVKYGMGEIILENISAKRGTSLDLSDYQSYGYLRYLVSLAGPVACLVTAKLISSRRHKLRLVLVLLLSSATALFFAILVSSRGGFMFTVINLFAIAYYLQGRKLSLMAIAAGGLALLLIFGGMTILRGGSGVGDLPEQGLSITRIFEPVVVNKTFLDVSKTAHVMAGVPNILDYQLGQTLIPIFIAWIPRALWQDKPITNMDSIIGQELFGMRQIGEGVPVGLIAEMYWNYWYPGIIVGCFFVGFLLRWIYTEFQRYSHNRNIVILYVNCFMVLGFSIVGSSITPILISFLASFVPLYCVLHFIVKRK